MPDLLEPIVIGDLHLPNRVIMAPLTRCRAGDRRVPNALMAEYYAQRASAGLIISEATSVSPMGVGYPDTPGIWSREQVEGWKLVTRAVHNAGGRILLQLWHVGRMSDPYYLDGALPVAPSAIAAERPPSLLRPQKPFVTPRALETSEIPGIVEEYRRGAENAQARRLRRRRDPRGQRLPARPVPPGQLEPSDRRVRRPDREPGPADARGRRRGRLGLGARAGRHAPRSSRRCPLDGRFGPAPRRSDTSRGSSAGGAWRSSACASRSARAASGPS